MRFDDRGIGGFFEDLPVLIFVLSGVSILMLSGIRVGTLAEDQEDEDSLRHAAEMLVQSIAAAADSGFGYPTVDSFNSTRIAELASDTVGRHSYAVSVVKRYPELGWILVCGGGDGIQTPSLVVSDSVLLNAMDRNGRFVVLEVIALVW